MRPLLESYDCIPFFPDFRFILYHLEFLHSKPCKPTKHMHEVPNLKDVLVEGMLDYCHEQLISTLLAT